jgi:formate hydrogenlyase subunit 6/NADH:ubiquinone oxidoreductase subunit I
MSNPEKSVDIYERLADTLDTLPQGFPRTKSGVEIKLIKMAFTPEEVSLAGQMTRFSETAAEIAKRVGMDEAIVRILLEGLIPRKLVRLDAIGAASYPGMAPSVKGVKKYMLGPFMVGWYEANMRLLDKEFAELFEQYVIEGGGEKILAPRPGVFGVVPVRGSLNPELMAVMEPHLDIDAHFKRHERFLVMDCVCKREKELLGHLDCKLPMKRCGFIGLPPQTPLGENVLDREEADKLFYELEQMGHVHNGAFGYIMDSERPQFVGGCNCDRCCCGIFANGHIPQVSNYRVVKDYDKCIGCGSCVTRCPTYAHTESDARSDGKQSYDRAKCIGCGVCVIACPTDAIELEPVSAEEWFHTPSSMAEWEEMRLKNMAAKTDKG